ncbi:MAG: methyltransferase [Phycisphaerae bacterium]
MTTTTTTTTTSTSSTPDLAVTTMIDLMKGLWLARALNTAAELALPDLLATGPKSLDHLAHVLNAHPNALRRLLRALISEGFFIESDGLYANTPKSESFRSDFPWSMRASARAQLGQEHYAAWEELLHCTQTGNDGVTKKFGHPIWDYYAQNPHHAAVFHDSMTSLTSGIEAAVLDAFDFSPFHHIIDIGGSHGRLLTQILSQSPASKGTLFDTPRVIAGAQNLDPRITPIAGDFFHAVPAHGDLYTLKFIIHDWPDEDAIKILANIRSAMNPSAKILLIETVIPEGHAPAFSKFMDLNMLVMTGGQERTAAEYADLFRAANLQLSRVIPTQSVCSIIEASAV